MKNNQITIAIACDGFTIIHDDKRYWINQEDDPSIKLRELFESIGYTVTVEEDY
jgi:hypothetical protein